MRAHSLIPLIFPCLMLQGCGTDFAYKKENFQAQNSMFEKNFNHSSAVVFEAAKKVLTHAGYTIEKQDPKVRGFIAQKQFQEDDTTQILTVSSNVSANAKKGSDIWLVAQETHFETDETTETADLAALTFSIPIPTGSTQTSVKELGKTIDDEEFYGNLFTAIANDLDDAEKKVNAIKEEEYQTAVEDELRALKAKQEAQAMIQKQLQQQAQPQVQQAPPVSLVDSAMPAWGKQQE